MPMNLPWSGYLGSTYAFSPTVHLRPLPRREGGQQSFGRLGSTSSLEKKRTSEF